MADTAFQNIDDSALEATRQAELEAYRQSLIAYDANPVPVSSDLDNDTDADGLYWDSAVGAWVSTGGEGNGSSLPPLWTTNDATSEITGTSAATTVPLTLTASDENSAVLSLFPAPGGSYLATPLVEFYDDTGTKIGDFDASGLLALYDTIFGKRVPFTSSTTMTRPGTRYSESGLRPGRYSRLPHQAPARRS